ncbi:GNAT family N-acetyltransferase [Pelagibius sp.]|uniref:GNAT family N-acetyltransferase n=1 Tax=Pelagibius sp. TaxID=1931238 RepID=UPI003BAF6FB5
MSELRITIRRARTDEAEALTELSLRSKQSNGYDEAFMAACRDELTVTGERLAEGEYWVAESGELCGCACLLAGPDGRSGEVHAFFIDPAWQRRGVGRLIWQKLLERAMERGITELHLDADPAAVPFYEAMGFAIVGESPSDSIPGRKLPHMTASVTYLAG